MQVINISQQIDTANNLILELKPVLQTYGTFDYQILAKGKDLPTFVLQISFVKKNVWTSILIHTIQKITKKDYYFTLDTIEDQTKIALNIII
jgi:hypothetical protein